LTHGARNISRGFSTLDVCHISHLGELFDIAFARVCDMRRDWDVQYEVSTKSLDLLYRSTLHEFPRMTDQGYCRHQDTAVVVVWDVDLMHIPDMAFHELEGEG
jgi:hypothetical protein